MRRLFIAASMAVALSTAGCLKIGEQAVIAQDKGTVDHVPGCDSNGNSGDHNPHCTPPSPSPQITSTPLIVPIGWAYLFDSANNLYSSTGAYYNSVALGLLKTAPGGQTTTFFSGHAVILIGKDSLDNIYVMTNPTGTFYVNGSDASTISIQKVSSDGSVSVICGFPLCSSIELVQGAGTGGGVVDSNGNLFIPLVIWAPHDGSPTRWAFSKIAKITPAGALSIFSGAHVASSTIGRCHDGNSANATFSGMTSMIIDNTDTIYVKDSGINGSVCNSLRKITPTGDVSTIHNFGSANVSGFITTDESGNFYFYEYTEPSTGSIIKKLSPSGVESNYCGGAVYAGAPLGACSNSYLQQIIGNLVFDALGNLHFMLNGAGSSPSASYQIAPAQ